MKGNVAAIALVLTGIFLLLNNLKLINISFWEVASTWWPAVLIILGVAMFFPAGGNKKE